MILRLVMASGVCFLVWRFFGPRMIGWLARRFLEPNRSDSARLQELHREKAATPTMGGLFIVGLAVAASLLLADQWNPYLAGALALAIGLGTIGAIDDLVKMRSAKNGLRPRTKIIAQWVVCAAVAAFVQFQQAGHAHAGTVFLPLWNVYLPLGLGAVPLATMAMVATSNAVNLTDGLDGLAGSCLIWAFAAMGAIIWFACSADDPARSMLVPIAALVGSLLGFLRFNRHPARVFMGDTGSLPLGGLLGYCAVVARQELLLVAVGGVFVAEALSVILQVSIYKWRRRRVFLCAPLHHHFQFQGLHETQIVARFRLAAAGCAMVGLLAIWS